MNKSLLSTQKNVRGSEQLDYDRLVQEILKTHSFEETTKIFLFFSYFDESVKGGGVKIKI